MNIKYKCPIKTLLKPRNASTWSYRLTSLRNTVAQEEMKIKIESKMQKKPDDAFETFASLNWLFKIFGLSILRRENNVLKARYSWIQIIFVVTFVIVLLALAIYDIINTYSNGVFAKRKSKFSVFVRLTWIASFINYIENTAPEKL